MSSRAPSSRGRLMTTLFAAQVCGSTGHSIGMAIGGIMAASITGTNTWSGMPIAVGALGTALASWPLSRLMERWGRRPGLALGYGLAVLGALARDGRRHDRKLRAAARRHGAVRRLANLELAEPATPPPT